MEAVASPATNARYIRIPHWVRVEHRSFQPGGPFFDVRLKAREHRARRGSLSIRGVLFESEVHLRGSMYVTLTIDFSDDSALFEFHCRIVRSRQVEDDHLYMVTAEFIAGTEKEADGIARFASRYY